MERRKKTKSNTVWNDYFHKIKSVCPWSLSAWKRDQILITTWKQGIQPLQHYQAVMYLHPNASARQLKKLEAQLNTQYSEYEFLHSHPVHKHLSTPIPCIIQQHSEHLAKLRANLDK